MSSVEALLAELDGIAAETDRALVRHNSRDFFRYSPVLKRQLNTVAAKAVVMPKTEAKMTRLLAAALRHRVPVTLRGRILATTGRRGRSEAALCSTSARLIASCGPDRVSCARRPARP